MADTPRDDAALYNLSASSILRFEAKKAADPALKHALEAGANALAAPRPSEAEEVGEDHPLYDALRRADDPTLYEGEDGTLESILDETIFPDLKRLADAYRAALAARRTVAGGVTLLGSTPGSCNESHKYAKTSDGTRETAARDGADELRELVRHCWIHSGYPNCGYLQMTTEQKALFGEIIDGGTQGAEAPRGRHG